MNIIDFIPKGKANAITRENLMLVTGLPDRIIREMISQARREAPIVNFGHGYYIATEKAEAERFLHQEMSRLKSIGWSMKGARDMIKEFENG